MAGIINVQQWPTSSFVQEMIQLLQYFTSALWSHSESNVAIDIKGCHSQRTSKKYLLGPHLDQGYNAFGSRVILMKPKLTINMQVIVKCSMIGQIKVSSITLLMTVSQLMQ